MRRAIESLAPAAEHLLIDGRKLRDVRLPQQAIIKGDTKSLSIAAASILAKVTRDRIMRAEAEHHPYWSFELNKGYPCPKHKTALQGLGPSAIHRRSWVFMDHLSWGGVPPTPPNRPPRQPRWGRPSVSPLGPPLCRIRPLRWGCSIPL